FMADNGERGHGRGGPDEYVARRPVEYRRVQNGMWPEAPAPIRKRPRSGPRSRRPPERKIGVTGTSLNQPKRGSYWMPIQGPVLPGFWREEMWSAHHKRFVRPAGLLSRGPRGAGDKSPPPPPPKTLGTPPPVFPPPPPIPA